MDILGNTAQIPDLIGGIMFTCTACNKFTCTMSEMILLHQAQCESLPQEKRDFRMAVVLGLFGENADEALALAREMEGAA